MQKILLFWSGGKDSCLALHYLKQDPSFKIMGLVSTIEEETNAVRFHGIKENLLKKQAELLNLPLQRIYVPKDCSNFIYEEKIKNFLERFKNAGITHLAFGDIHLTEIRQYREDLFARLGFQCHFPLWQKSQEELIKTFLETGYKACITSVMKDLIDSKWIGKDYNQEFINTLTEGIDSLGENGEFHTFVYYTPGMKTRVPFFKAVLGEDGPYQFVRLEEP